jgi:hypothetical protein
MGKLSFGQPPPLRGEPADHRSDALAVEQAADPNRGPRRRP